MPHVEAADQRRGRRHPPFAISMAPPRATARPLRASWPAALRSKADGRGQGPVAYKSATRRPKRFSGMRCGRLLDRTRQTHKQRTDRCRREKRGGNRGGGTALGRSPCHQRLASLRSVLSAAARAALVDWAEVVGASGGPRRRSVARQSTVRPGGVVRSASSGGLLYGTTSSAPGGGWLSGSTAREPRGTPSDIPYNALL